MTANAEAINFNELERTWIVAEIGVNHEGDEKVAAELIAAAAAAGADAVKFQTFEIEHYISSEQPERRARSQRFQLSRDAFRRLADVAAANEIVFFSTPLGFDDVDFLDTLAPIIKISSGDLTFLALIEHAARTGKPMIISTGIGDEREIAAAVEAVLKVRPTAARDGSLALMHCVAAYPTPAPEANLRNLKWLHDTFGLPVGYSDHTLGVKACELAVAAGARLLEKHFTYRKENQAFHDHAISADPQDLKTLIENVRTAEAYLGSYQRRPGEAEAANAPNMRRSIAMLGPAAAGDVATRENLTWLRPAWGLGPDQMDAVVGRRFKHDMNTGQLVRAEDLE